jgi:hypothetical protein
MSYKIQTGTTWREGEIPVNMKAEVEDMWPQAKECKESSDTGRGKE